MSFGPSSAKVLHAEIEAIKLAKSDIYRYVADPKFTNVPVLGLLSKDYASMRRSLINMSKAGPFPEPGTPAGASLAAGAVGGAKPYPDNYDAEQHTTSFSIVDSSGNAIAV